MSTRIHASVDGSGQPTALFLAPGRADCNTAETSLGDIEAGMRVIANKANYTTAFLDHLAEVGGTAFIPSRGNRMERRMLGTELNATRNLVERFFERIREFRRVAIRYGERAREFLSPVIFAATGYLTRGIAKARF